ncbi:MAG: thiazole synthase [Pseudomonadota bacterium]
MDTHDRGAKSNGNDGNDDRDGATPGGNDPLRLYDRALASRLLLGTAQYPAPQVLKDAVNASQAGVVTVSLRRELARLGQAGATAGQGQTPSHARPGLEEGAGGGTGPDGPARESIIANAGTGQTFFDLIAALDVHVLPNTAGCRTPREAITTAHMARELFDTAWIKLEVIANDDTLQPDVFGLVSAAEDLAKDGFEVFPYTTEDLSVAERLLRAGCEVLMPWGAPIGTGRGLNNRYGLRSMRSYFPNVPLIVDAGIGAPSHAADVMELGYDAVLLNTAVAKAADPVAMARAFAMAIDAGRVAHHAGLMEMRDMAQPSTPVAGTAFFEL